MKKFIQMISIIMTVATLFASIPIMALESTSLEMTPITLVPNVARIWDLYLSKAPDNTISRKNFVTKNLTDFAGNQYVLGECDPSGYFIYHIGSGTFVEYSYTSISPYVGHNDNIKYCGPSEYYVGDGESYNHLLNDFTIESTDMVSYTSASSTINASLNQEKNWDNLTYVNEGDVSATMATRSSARMITNILHADYIYDLVTRTEMGYAESNDNDGICGYIAAGIMLLYFHRSDSSLNLIDNSYLNDDGTAFNGGDFTLHLRYTYGTFDSSTAIGISNVVEEYCEDKNTSATTWSTLLPTTTAIIDRLQTNLPVGVFGSIYIPSKEAYKFHGVVAYAYTSEDEIIGHLGHPNQAEVYITTNLPWGSAFTINSITD